MSRRARHVAPPAPRRAPDLSGIRLAGFLRINRSILAVTAGLITISSVGINDLPASAATLVEETQAAAPKIVAPELTVSGSVEDSDVVRDGFGVEVRSLVMWPLPSTTKIADGFGYRIPPCRGCSSDHQGVDFNPGGGAPITAIADGTVTATGNPSGALGVYAIIEHELLTGETVKSVYGHMASGSMDLSIGDSVQRGQIVGVVGSTGQSTGNHLHFGILKNDKAIDPLEWLRKNVNS